MLHVPSTCCTDNINAIAEFVSNASESVFFHRIYCSRDSVCELIQVIQVMVEHKHVLLHIPIRKSRMVSCLGILGAKSVMRSLWVPCVQSNVEAMFHLETDELGCANVAMLRLAEK